MKRRYPAARREFAEETGHDPEGDFLPLGEARQLGGKVVQAWAIEGDCDPAILRSCAHPQRYLRDGMAAALWAPTDLSGDRPRGLVRCRRGATEDPEGDKWFSVDRLLEALGPSSEPVATMRRSVSGLRRMVDCIQLA